MSSNDKPMFFQGISGASDGYTMQWTFQSPVIYERFYFSTRLTPLQDIPRGEYVAGITYFNTKNGKLIDTQYSITGSMNPCDANTTTSAIRELEEELGVTCDISHMGIPDIVKVGWQTYTTYVISARTLRPISLRDIEKHSPYEPGKDIKSQKIQIFIHGTCEDFVYLTSQIKYRRNAETDIAGITIIPVKMVIDHVARTSQYRGRK